MDDIWACHTELIRDLQAFKVKVAEEKVALQAKLYEAWEQDALAEREKARLFKENMALESQLLSQWQEARALWTIRKAKFMKSEEF